METQSVLTQQNLNGIASELNPNCEITKQVVYLLYKDGGMKAVEEYIKTFKPVEANKKRYERVLLSFGVMVWNWIKRTYKSLKSIIKSIGVAVNNLLIDVLQPEDGKIF